MKKLILSTACLALVFGCGKNNSDGGENPKGCPAAVYTPYHEVSVETLQDLPEKLSIEVEGKVEYDECLEQPVITPAPIVTVERKNAGITFTVQHFGAYDELPEDISFKIFDKGSCDAGESLFFSKDNLPLTFEKSFPAGENCGSNTFSKVSVSE